MRGRTLLIESQPAADASDLPDFRLMMFGEGFRCLALLRSVGI
jgi:hypothetical protein